MGEQPASNHRSRFQPEVPLLDVLGDMQLSTVKYLEVSTQLEEFLNVKKEYGLI